MDVLTCDFETHYAKTYSIQDMPMWDYILDKRFEAIGVSVKVNDAPAQAFSGSHAETHDFLAQFDWRNSALCAHNAAFDGAILNWHFKQRPKAIIDTWSMCVALHGVEGSTSLARMAEYYKVGVKGTEREAALGKRRADFTPQQLNDYMAYCCQDSNLTYDLCRVLMANAFPVHELRIIDWTIRCYTEPKLQLDRALLLDELNTVLKRRAVAWDSVGLSDPTLLRKDDTLADMLRKFGVEPPIKTTAKGNRKFAFSKTDVEFLELREHEDERVGALVDARLEAKSSIEATRLQTLSEVESYGIGLPFPTAYFGASTGRWSAYDDINLQNLPKKGRIRECIIAPPDSLIVGSDLSQIELRTLAWISGQQDTLDALAQGLDPYAMQATAVYGYEINKRDHPTERFVGKGLKLGGGYGAGWRKVMSVILADAKKYGITLPDTSNAFFERIVQAYRDSNPKIVSLWGEARRALPRMVANQSGYIGRFEFRGNTILMPRGIPLRFPNLRKVMSPETGYEEYVYDRYSWKKKRSFPVKIWHGLLVENINQALARDVFANCITNSTDVGYPSVGAVHDELLFVIKKADLDTALVKIKQAMTTPPAWLTNCPLECETNYGKSYAEVK